MIPSTVRIMVCTLPQDMRRSFDGLALVVQQALGENPQSGALYIFVGKRPTRVKVLWWDRNGYCLLYKRLHRALFRIPPTCEGAAAVQIDADALAQLLAGVATEKKKNVPIDQERLMAILVA
jgi:transposase